jgi:hypothetical protein
VTRSQTISKVLTAAELSACRQVPGLEALVVPTAQDLLHLTEQALHDAGITSSLTKTDKLALRRALMDRLGLALTDQGA